jgi:hypothetical protein
MNSSPAAPEEEIMRRQDIKEFVKEHPRINKECKKTFLRLEMAAKRP